jgi:hypothetical protein
MIEVLTFVKDFQGWQSSYNGKLVVASNKSLNNDLSYAHGCRIGTKGDAVVSLEECFGFYIAHPQKPIK